ncbi:hypothetical protein K491DRAFT_759055 [Lophiostoma macrostomum CBS 122681]|uniref:F-box domain-containing protein n=1 Tax=Lophiostoma macrostomum CBS 122681 TaxID=1314788 RepID=A0A6A6T567_9PLEO|nr:hypothetical protein K491DRAFT_759055 [Lophiostoma macrostomum CBS 122681]
MYHPPAFRFLDLPAELRLMTYEAITIETKSRVLRVPSSSDTMTLNVQTIPTALLSTCRFIYVEATLSLNKKMSEIIKAVPRIEFDRKDYETVHIPRHVVIHEVINVIFEGVRFIRDSQAIPDRESVLQAAVDGSPGIAKLHNDKDLRILYQFISQAARHLTSGPADLPLEGQFSTGLLPICVLCLHRTPKKVQKNRNGLSLLQDVSVCNVEYITYEFVHLRKFPLQPPTPGFWRQCTYMMMSNQKSM